MRVFLAVIVCAILAHYFGRVTFGGGDSKHLRIKVAYMTKMGKRQCLQIDFADLATEENPVDLGSTLSVAKMDVIAQYCEDFNLSDHANDILVVIPGRVDSQCFHYSNCKAFIIIKNKMVVQGNSKCYDVAVGQFVHSQVEYIVTFQVRNIMPHGFTCHKQNMNTFSRPNLVKRSITDIWSPVEDLEKDAVDQISKLGEQFSATINEQLNALQSDITKQFTDVTQAVTQSTTAVTSSITESYGEVKDQIEKIDTFIKRDVSNVEKYFHYFMHAVQILGILVVLVILYKIYKKAHAVYNIFSWVWQRLTGRHNHQHAVQHRPANNNARIP